MREVASWSWGEKVARLSGWRGDTLTPGGGCPSPFVPFCAVTRLVPLIADLLTHSSPSQDTCDNACNDSCSCTDNFNLFFAVAIIAFFVIVFAVVGLLADVGIDFFRNHLKVSIARPLRSPLPPLTRPLKDPLFLRWPRRLDGLHRHHVPRPRGHARPRRRLHQHHPRGPPPPVRRPREPGGHRLTLESVSAPSSSPPLFCSPTPDNFAQVRIRSQNA